jgi:hypothetical protein
MATRKRNLDDVDDDLSSNEPEDDVMLKKQKMEASTSATSSASTSSVSSSSLSSLSSSSTTIVERPSEAKANANTAIVLSDKVSLFVLSFACGFLF